MVFTPCHNQSVILVLCYKLTIHAKIIKGDDKCKALYSLQCSIYYDIAVNWSFSYLLSYTAGHWKIIIIITTLLNNYKLHKT